MEAGVDLEAFMPDAPARHTRRPDSWRCDCAPDAPELELVVEAAPSSVFAVLGGVW